MAGIIKAVDLASALKVKPLKVKSLLKIELGGKVKKGDLLAAKKTLLGQEEKVYSPVNGLVEKLESLTGLLLIKEISREKNQPFFKKKKPAVKIKGFLGFGKTKGKLKSYNHNLSLENISLGFQKAIVAVPFIESPGVYHKLAALGAKGLIVKEIKEEWLEKLTRLKTAAGFDFSFLAVGDKINLLKKYHQSSVVCNGWKKVLLIF